MFFATFAIFVVKGLSLLSVLLSSPQPLMRPDRTQG
jgi:hypothetical protein